LISSSRPDCNAQETLQSIPLTKFGHIFRISHQIYEMTLFIKQWNKMFSFVKKNDM